MLGLKTTPRVLSTLILVGALFAATAHAAADQTRFDLFKQVQQQVLRYAYYTVFDDINIVVEDDGTVTLTGSVTGGHKKAGIERRVAGIDGVTRVNNEIELLPVSSNDDQLRRLVARAIYGNPNFGRYGATVNPSDPHHRQWRPCHPHGCRHERGRSKAGSIAGRAVPRVLGDQRAPASR